MRRLDSSAPKRSAKLPWSPPSAPAVADGPRRSASTVASSPPATVAVTTSTTVVTTVATIPAAAPVPAPPSTAAYRPTRYRRFERPQVVLGSGTQVLVHPLDGCLVTALHGRRQVGDVTSFEFDSDRVSPFGRGQSPGEPHVVGVLQFSAGVDTGRLPYRRIGDAVPLEQSPDRVIMTLLAGGNVVEDRHTPCPVEPPVQITRQPFLLPHQHQVRPLAIGQRATSRRVQTVVHIHPITPFMFGHPETGRIDYAYLGSHVQRTNRTQEAGTRCPDVCVLAMILDTSTATSDFVNRHGGSATLAPRLQMYERYGKTSVDGT